MERKNPCNRPRSCWKKSTGEVNRQLEDRIHIYEKRSYLHYAKSRCLLSKPQCRAFPPTIRKRLFPGRDIPLPATGTGIQRQSNLFLRDNRLYLAVRLFLKGTNKEDADHLQYFVMKLPYSKVPALSNYPAWQRLLSDVYRRYYQSEHRRHFPRIRSRLQLLYQNIERCRYYDRRHDQQCRPGGTSKEKIKKRKIGAVCRFVYDRAMPDDFLNFLVDAFRIRHEELVPGDKHLNLEDLRHLPNPNHSIPRIERPIPMKLNRLNDKESIFSYVEKKDLLLYYPYHSFDHFIHFLYEAVHNPETREIMVTQYRVAENSAVINTLIAAAQKR